MKACVIREKKTGCFVRLDRTGAVNPGSQVGMFFLTGSNDTPPEVCAVHYMNRLGIPFQEFEVVSAEIEIGDVVSSITITQQPRKEPSADS